MPSLAPIDFNTKLAAATEPPSRTSNEPRANGENGGGFAATLQRRTNADAVEKPASEPAEPKDQQKPASTSTGSDKDTPAEKSAKPAVAEPVSTSDGSETVATATSPTDHLPDPSLPILLNAPIPAPTQELDATTDVPDLTLPLLGPAVPLAATATVPASAQPTAELRADDALVPDVVAKPAALATSQADFIAAPTPNATPLSTPGADPTVPVSGEAISNLVASTPVVAVGGPAAPLIAASDHRTVNSVTTTTQTTATDVPLDAALPPVTDADAQAPVALPLPDTGLVATEKTAASEDSAPITTQLLNTATPATQSAAMHTVVSSISAKDKAVAEDASSAANPSGKLIPEAPSTIAAPVANAPVVSPTRPLSEAVLAQATLATNGNAMEKAVSHQVSKALVQHLPNGDKMMVLRLTPPELGTVKVEVIERQGVLSARLHAEDDGVRLALERFLPSMRQDLRAHDAPIRELTLSDQTQFQRSFADGQQQQHQQDTNRSDNRREREGSPRFSVDAIRSEPVAMRPSAPLGGRVGVSGVDARA